MKYVRIIGIVLGSLICLYGLGAVGLSLVQPVKTTLGWYGGVATCVVSGITISLLSYLFTRNSQKVNPEELPTKQIVTPTYTTDENARVKMTNIQLADYESLNHLTTRFMEAKDDEGIKLCKSLQDRIFELHYKNNNIK